MSQAWCCIDVLMNCITIVDSRAVPSHLRTHCWIIINWTLSKTINLSKNVRVHFVSASMSQAWCCIDVLMNCITIVDSRAVPSHLQTHCWIIISWTLSKTINLSKNVMIVVYENVMMRVMASQITGSPASRLFAQPFEDLIEHKNSASLAFVRIIYRWPVDSPHKGPVTRNMFPFDDVIM